MDLDLVGEQGHFSVRRRRSGVLRVAGAQISAGVTLMAGRSPWEDVTAFPQVTMAQLRPWGGALVLA